MAGSNHAEAPLPSGLKAFAWRAERHLQLRWWVARGLRHKAVRIHAMSERLQHLSQLDLQRRMREQRDRIVLARSFRIADEDEALALICETASRTTGMRPYAVQIMGALATDRGCLVEMQTGEGKSLTAALSAVMSSWTGAPCHVLTSNTYLATRDATFFAAFYAACGLSVASIGEADQSATRLAAYAADIVYTTAKELLADVLRDEISLGGTPTPTALCLQMLSSGGAKSGQVGRGLGVAIVDEADSLLIDDAVTPLIIATEKPLAGFEDAIREAVRIAGLLKQKVHFDLHPEVRRVRLNDLGVQVATEYVDDFRPPWASPTRVVDLVNLALTASCLLEQGRHFVIEKEQLILLDEQTGRRAVGRHLSHGLHQALEIARGLKPTPLSEIAGRRSFQRFFRAYPRLAGLTGTAAEAAKEFWFIYQMPVVRIPSHLRSRRSDLPLQLLTDENVKLTAVAAEAVSIAAQGRAVLVGTRTIGTAERMALLIHRIGGTYRLLTASDESVEAAVVAAAGEPTAITIATNMAGRGTDIRLPATVAAAGGLHVILAEVNDLSRIDRQMAGRAARQGEPGSSRRFLSPDDRVFHTAKAPLLQRLLRCACLFPPSIASRVGALLLSVAQARHARMGVASRRAVLVSDLQFEEAGL
ncbi:preprotein translocase subunit SecA [Falsiroseomonas stagni]|uniref:Preprotein translocase subunit SecA n=1 Tax=Falsiroseomonas stagni DSM 19981 TaxID=1123062 RepID=A0A1I4F6G0_9PROT|nr:DEAD/DEAH box helicase [Falsiroseomonas stagni]SFL13572.1 preprotein translocase subunit SecA [Falsiroseomonas stagni DSM 19981]